MVNCTISVRTKQQLYRLRCAILAIMDTTIRNEGKPRAGMTLVIWGLTLLATIACATFLVQLQNQENTTPQVISDKNIHVSLGALGYSIQASQAIKRHDPGIIKLYNFLSDAARKDIRSGCAAAYYSVAAYTAEEDQVFVKYGCTSPDSPMYAVKHNGEWELLSPTNHFDTFGIADCDYLTTHNINPQIAPVCATGLGQGEPQYATRS
jgi:hypothetical protein